MVPIINAVAFASVLTAGFTLRYRMWKKPWLVVLYFGSFLGIEVLAHRYFIPEVAFGIELAYVCFGLTIALIATTIGVIAYEKNNPTSDQ